MHHMALILIAILTTSRVLANPCQDKLAADLKYNLYRKIQVLDPGQKEIHGATPVLVDVAPRGDGFLIAATAISEFPSQTPLRPGVIAVFDGFGANEPLASIPINVSPKGHWQPRNVKFAANGGYFMIVDSYQGYINRRDDSSRTAIYETAYLQTLQTMSFPAGGADMSPNGAMVLQAVDREMGSLRIFPPSYRPGTKKDYEITTHLASKSNIGEQASHAWITFNTDTSLWLMNGRSLATANLDGSGYRVLIESDGITQVWAHPEVPDQLVTAGRELLVWNQNKGGRWQKTLLLGEPSDRGFGSIAYNGSKVAAFARNRSGVRKIVVWDLNQTRPADDTEYLLPSALIELDVDSRLTSRDNSIVTSLAWAPEGILVVGAEDGAIRLFQPY